MAVRGAWEPHMCAEHFEVGERKGKEDGAKQALFGEYRNVSREMVREVNK